MRLDRVGILQAIGIQANPATQGYVNIIDVSGWTGPINHSQLEPYVLGLKEPRIDGAIVRLVDGTSFDVYGFANYVGFKQLGLPVGVYGAFYPRASALANKKQAEKMVAGINDLGEYPALGVWGDYEKNPDKLSVYYTRLAIIKYIDTFELSPDMNILGAYSNYWWDDNVANERNGATDIPRARDGKPRDVWLASWYAKIPYVIWDWRQRYGSNCWTLHQYENRFKFPGIPGSVDMSTFNGTMQEYYKHFKLEGTPPPIPGEDEMKYRVLANGLKIRSAPDATKSNIVGQRLEGDVIIPLETVGDMAFPGAYWVRDGLGWSAAQYYNPPQKLMQSFVE